MTRQERYHHTTSMDCDAVAMPTTEATQTGRLSWRDPEISTTILSGYAPHPSLISDLTPWFRVTSGSAHRKRRERVRRHTTVSPPGASHTDDGVVVEADTACGQLHELPAKPSQGEMEAPVEGHRNSSHSHAHRWVDEAVYVDFQLASFRGHVFLRQRAG